MSLRTALWICLFLVIPAAAAYAGDGRIEINQARALAGGVTSGDTPGFPVTISEPGSYVLTGDLDVPAGFPAISGTVDGATIDLNGFSLVGPVTCSGATVTCSSTSGGPGINLGGDSNEVRNGRVQGFGGGGVFFSGLNNRALDLRVSSNAGAGIAASSFAIVRGNSVLVNLDEGILIATSSLALDNAVYANGGDGISSGGGGYIAGNRVTATVGNAALATGGGTGLSAVGYRNNQFSGPGTVVTGSGIDMGGNLCTGSTTCP